MCNFCEGQREESIEVTEDNLYLMLNEVTTAALQAAASYSNGWFHGAKGLGSDMILKWGLPGAVRLAYVWGAASYFLPRPPDAPTLQFGHSEATEFARKTTGHEPDASLMARIVSASDQAGAVMRAIVEASAKDDPEKIMEELEPLNGSDTVRALMSLLMGEAGIRLRYAEDQDDELLMDLFMAHVHAAITASECGHGDG
ncbi:hypothetical protein [Streptomyces sp. NPDC059278]|uniref:hypothetical protein n=1 Tax=Streptomyces sp. NPDC059278 TaxID=3346801 RepID=UPI0036868A1F